LIGTSNILGINEDKLTTAVETKKVVKYSLEETDGPFGCCLTDNLRSTHCVGDFALRLFVGECNTRISGVSENDVINVCFF
jgi:hypothetical protein